MEWAGKSGTAMRRMGGGRGEDGVQPRGEWGGGRGEDGVQPRGEWGGGRKEEVV